MTMTPSRSRRPLGLTALLLAACLAASVPVHAQTVNPDDILYILPYGGPFGGSDAALAAEIADVRNRLGPEGPYVKFGFTVYIFLNLNAWNVDTTDPTALREQFMSSILRLRSVSAQADRLGIPVSFSILTATRDRYDNAQRESEAEDIRNMQWYADNVLAAGWWNYSRYARKQRMVLEAYIRELGKELASLMQQYPDSVVVATGDGEVELAFARNTIYADYSPFTIAEFRDWLRLGGLYAPGSAYAGQGYMEGARYAGDLTPGTDTNGDGHTLNGDFGTAFQTWDLLHFNWDLADAYAGADPRRIPLDTYNAPGFTPLPASVPGGFDAPRAPAPGSAWWDIWLLFKQTMLQHFNKDFARWATTSADPVSGTTVPATRWYSYQVPADYLYNGSPEAPNERWHSSMSSYWTADISPLGGLGITSFNIDFGDWDAVTLRNVAPRIAERDVRWGVIEWHPGVLPGDTGVSSKTELFRTEMEVVERYRPSLLQPFGWNIPNYEIKGTPFETTLRDLVARIRDGQPPNPQMTLDAPASGSTLTQPFALSGWAVDLGKIRGPGRGPGIDLVHVYAYPDPGSGTPAIFLGSATYGNSRPDVGATYGSQFSASGFSFTVAGLPAGRYDLVAYGRSTVSMAFNVSRTVTVDVVYAGSVSPAALHFGATKAGADGDLVSVSAPQIVSLGYDGPGVPVWAASSSQAWIQLASGPAAGQFTVSVANPGNVIGGASRIEGVVTFTAANVGASATLPVALVVQTAGSSSPPFGAFDMPSDGASDLSGSFAVTGWALDDIGVNRVELWRDLVPGETTVPYYGPGHPGHGKVFIAHALFVEGSRPDVEGLYPAYPFSRRAGWGYLLLSWGLWNQGNGVFTFYAFAFDEEGQAATLGTKTVTVDNARAVKPFGALDTPTYGGLVTSPFWNYGWALTPNATPPCTIANGHVLVSIDSGPLVPVNYGDLRPDIAAAFPGFSNGTSSGGAYFVDTTQLADGMHQIGWLVTDSCGRQDGVGSRFFRVRNAAGRWAAAPASAKPSHTAGQQDNLEPVSVRRDGEEPDWVWPIVEPATAGKAAGNTRGERWVRVVDAAPDRRIEIHLPDVPGGPYDGGHLVEGEWRPLPLGSTLDRKAGVFYWQPAPAFRGAFDFVFRDAAGGAVRVRVVIR